MEIDYQLLKPETLRTLIEEFVTRDGTDYGNQEASLERKIADVRKLIERKHVIVVFDEESQSCDLRERP